MQSQSPIRCYHTNIASFVDFRRFRVPRCLDKTLKIKSFLLDGEHVTFWLLFGRKNLPRLVKNHETKKLSVFLIN